MREPKSEWRLMYQVFDKDGVEMFWPYEREASAVHMAKNIDGAYVLQVEVLIWL